MPEAQRYAIVFSRFIGKRGVGQVSPFEFILIIIISSAAGVPKARSGLIRASRVERAEVT